MHANLSITDGVYGILSDIIVQEQIKALGQEINKNDNGNEIVTLSRKLIELLDKN
jgi:hypothetical protein